MTETDIDQEICEGLRAQKSVDEIGAAFLERVLNPECTFDERRHRMRFLFISGLYASILEAYNQGLYLGLEMPFSYLIETAGLGHRTPSKELVDEVLALAKSPEQIKDLVIPQSWDELEPRIVEFRKTMYAELRAQFTDRLESLLERLSFYQNQRMVQEEKRLIERLKLLYPKDPRIIHADREFSERWARHVIAKASLDSLDSVANPSGPVQLEANQWPLANALLDEAARLTKENPKRAMDLTMMFWFLELYPQALIILESGAESVAASWLRVEILLNLRRFVDALDELKTLETHFANDSETTFAAIYLRAQALHGLGQESQALDLMRSLVNVRPEYRSARSFISKWSEGRL